MVSTPATSGQTLQAGEVEDELGYEERKNTKLVLVKFYIWRNS
jgi:hypothetical protein